MKSNISWQKDILQGWRHDNSGSFSDHKEGPPKQTFVFSTMLLSSSACSPLISNALIHVMPRKVMTRENIRSTKDKRHFLRTIVYSHCVLAGVLCACVFHCYEVHLWNVQVHCLDLCFTLQRDTVILGDCVSLEYFDYVLLSLLSFFINVVFILLYCWC